jgi:hypothetical protein
MISNASIQSGATPLGFQFWQLQILAILQGPRCAFALVRKINP